MKYTSIVNEIEYLIYRIANAHKRHRARKSLTNRLIALRAMQLKREESWLRSRGRRNASSPDRDVRSA